MARQYILISVDDAQEDPEAVADELQNLLDDADRSGVEMHFFTNAGDLAHSAALCKSQDGRAST